jgi:hypothetical protein
LEEVQNPQGAQVSPLYSQGAQKSLCEQVGEHLGNEKSKDEPTANPAKGAGSDDGLKAALAKELSSGPEQGQGEAADLEELRI